jgi:hypothetical protein
VEIRVNIPQEFAEQAQARGLRPEAYAEQILARQAKVESAEVRPPRTPQQIRAWLDSLAQFSGKFPALPQSISREWIYEDHD